MSNSAPSAKLLKELVELRHDIHRHPELAFAVDRTSSSLADCLEAAGLVITRNIGKTGFVATLSRGNSSRSIGLR